MKIKDSKRVEAARKGWETRRKNKLAKQLAGQISPVELKSEPKTQEVPEGFLTKAFGDESLAQIYNSGLEYAFINEKGEQCHPFCLCKDFLQDALWAELNKTATTIHGFTYKSGVNPPLDLSRTRLLARFKGKPEFAQMCQASLAFLNEVEESYGLEKTSLVFAGTSGKDQIWMFVGDNYWMQAPPMISLYTLMIRVGLNYQGGGWEEHLKSPKLVGSNDKYYLESSKAAIVKLKEKGPKNIFAQAMLDNYPNDCTVSDMHNYSGIKSLASNQIKQAVKKNWQVKEI